MPPAFFCSPENLGAPKILTHNHKYGSIGYEDDG
jgi:hypothetical protein